MRHVASATDPIAYLRDTMQSRVLARLFAQQTHGIVLKGGLAMRVLHDNARATKDIDLDADHSLPLKSIQTVVRRAIAQAATGLMTDVVVTEPKQTDTTMRWKIAGRDPATDQVLHLTVEVSHRRDIAPEEVRDLEPSDVKLFPKAIRVYTSEVLALTKIQALLSDHRDAPRDVLDLYMLITADIKPPLRALRNWVAAQSPSLVRQLWDKIETMDEARFRAEVAPSLPPSARSAEFADWDRVRVVVAEHVEAWIATATGPAPDQPAAEAVGAAACPR